MDDFMATPHRLPPPTGVPWHMSVMFTSTYVKGDATVTAADTPSQSKATPPSPSGVGAVRPMTVTSGEAAGMVRPEAAAVRQKRKATKRVIFFFLPKNTRLSKVA